MRPLITIVVLIFGLQGSPALAQESGVAVAQARRDAVAHAGVIARCGQVGVLDLHRREEAVADIRGDRHRAAAARHPDRAGASGR